MKILFMVLTIIVICLVTFSAYMGMFSSVLIVEKKMGPYHFVYKEMIGSDPSQIGEITTEINQYLISKNITNIRPFDVFYPENSGFNNEIGFMIHESKNEVMNNLPAGYKYKLIPEQNYMTTEFPYHNGLSYLVGFVKVDPALKQYRDERDYKKTEAISIHDEDVISYLQPVLKN